MTTHKPPTFVNKGNPYDNAYTPTSDGHGGEGLVSNGQTIDLNVHTAGGAEGTITSIDAQPGLLVVNETIPAGLVDLSYGISGLISGRSHADITFDPVLQTPHAQYPGETNLPNGTGEINLGAHNQHMGQVALPAGAEVAIEVSLTGVAPVSEVIDLTVT